ncbi:MAG: 50S ribosomal protein L24 [Mycoplasmataceae bacterium]|jgi:large subunit ribosomal protein L24|nr:50S ribosomal protein L24 [Mycoplasmataceae bacterium]
MGFARIKKGDKVRVISGKLLNKEAIVLKVFPKKNTAILEEINKVKKHTKPSQANENKGGIISIDAEINLSKLALVDPKAKRGISKVAYQLNSNGKKVRISKQSKNEIVTGGKK